MNSSTFCVMPFIGTQFNSNGTVSPCCRFMPNNDPKYNGPWMWDNFDHHWNNNLKSLRQDLLNNIKNPGCHNCWRDEAHNIKSYRQWVNEKATQFLDLTESLAVPVFQYYGFGNYCNLKCVMCHPSLSSSIETEYNQFQIEYSKIGRTWSFDHSPKWFKSEKFAELSEKFIEHARFIHLTGGEPFLTPEYMTLLRKIKQPDQVELIITTNLTVFNQDIVELLKKFKLVSLVISLEGAGKHNDYIRFGSKWEQICQNIEMVKDNNLDFIINHTLQHTSLYSLIDLIKFVSNKQYWLNIDMLTRPYELSLDSATNEEKTTFLNNLAATSIDTSMSSTVEKIIGLVNSSNYNEELNQQFWKYIATLDNIRGVRFLDVFK